LRAGGGFSVLLLGAMEEGVSLAASRVHALNADPKRTAYRKGEGAADAGGAFGGVRGKQPSSQSRLRLAE